MYSKIIKSFAASLIITCIANKAIFMVSYSYRFTSFQHGRHTII